jgi:hypothetical protein
MRCILMTLFVNTVLSLLLWLFCLGCYLRAADAEAGWWLIAQFLSSVNMAANWASYRSLVEEEDRQK